MPHATSTSKLPGPCHASACAHKPYESQADRAPGGPPVHAGGKSLLTLCKKPWIALSSKQVPQLL